MVICCKVESSLIRILEVFKQDISQRHGEIELAAAPACLQQLKDGTDEEDNQQTEEDQHGHDAVECIHVMDLLCGDRMILPQPQADYTRK